METIPAENGEKPKILVADDARIGRTILRKLLENDFAVVEAANGSDAVNALSTEGGRFAAVLCDVMMPVLDGFGVLSFMRENGLVGSIPAIMLTAIADPEAKARLFEAGATDVVEKPYDARLLVGKIRALSALRLRSAAADGTGAAEDGGDPAEERASFCESLLDALPAAVYSTDPKTHVVVYANSVFRSLPGVPDEPVGLDIRICLPTAADAMLAVWEDLVVRRVRGEREFRFPGDARAWGISYNALLDGSGEISELVGCITPRTR